MAQKVGRNTRMDSRGGQSGGGLGFSLGNPGEERRLASTLRKIDREKRKKETAMSWNQRSFFIKQVFDQDNELRFVKASQRPKYLNCIPPPPRDGDDSWLKEEYVFSFKPKPLSPESKDVVQGKHEIGPDGDSPKAGESEEGASADPPLQEEPKPDEQETAAETEKESEEAARERLEQEKRELATRGVFGARREKMKMPPLMSGAWKPKVDLSIKPEEVLEEKQEDSKVTTEPEENKDRSPKDEAEPLAQLKSNPGDTSEAVKPKTRFPVLKVRALGLFAMTFKKPPSDPLLKSQPTLHSNSTSDLKLLPISSPERDTCTSDLATSLPHNLTGDDRSPPPTGSAVAELHRPGSVSLPNSPIANRKPQLVRQQSDHSVLVKSLERPKTDRLKRALHTSESRHGIPTRGSRRDGTAKSNQERSKRHSPESGSKLIKSASFTLPKTKRQSTARTHPTSNLPKTDSSHIWGGSSESENQDKESQNNEQRGADDNNGEEEANYHVIRRIVRTLPAHLMLKTSKREVEAGGDVALLRQKMKDLARADTTRRALLDPRFKQLEKSLVNSP